MYRSLDGMFEYLPPALLNGDLDAAQRALVLEKRIDRYRKRARESYLERLKEGQASYLPGMIYMDSVGNFEKIGDHLTNIAQAAQRHFHYTMPREKRKGVKKEMEGSAPDRRTLD